MPDYIAKLENINKEYKKICKEIGINNPPKLPHKRKSKRKPYQDYYDKETKKLVKKRYKKDLKLFNYGFN